MNDDWELRWSSMPNYLVERWRHNFLTLVFDEDMVSADIHRVTLSEIPVEYIDRVSFASQKCPLCAKLTRPDKRTAAKLTLHFPSLPPINKPVSLGSAAWVHDLCLEKLSLLDEPAPVPW